MSKLRTKTSVSTLLEAGSVTYFQMSRASTSFICARAKLLHEVSMIEWHDLRNKRDLLLTKTVPRPCVPDIGDSPQITIVALVSKPSLRNKCICIFPSTLVMSSSPGVRANKCLFPSTLSKLHEMRKRGLRKRTYTSWHKFSADDIPTFVCDAPGSLRSSRCPPHTFTYDSSLVLQAVGADHCDLIFGTET